ncbi:hypothetical protein LWI29_010437 [Acer saccharum]|uniref:Uncharacterized protein n=1 Tax=Acer saccharum TaxID=4024 RepID=A0AA39VN87_ACESA|nr:hypothetical protein LWI29_010437 [Acer saccharum]
MESSGKDPYGPWMQVTYGRNVRNLGTGAVGKQGSSQSQGQGYGAGMKQGVKQGNGTGMKHGHGHIGAVMAGSIEGNNLAVIEDSAVKSSHNVSSRQGKIHSKKVLTEISNRKPPKKNQVSEPSCSYLTDFNVDKSYLIKPLKENSGELLAKSTSKWHKKGWQVSSKNSNHDTEEVIEDSVVLQALHSEIMELEVAADKEGTKATVDTNSMVDRVILSEVSNFEEVASKLKEAMDIALE